MYFGILELQSFIEFVVQIRKKDNRITLVKSDFAKRLSPCVKATTWVRQKNMPKLNGNDKLNYTTQFGFNTVSTTWRQSGIFDLHFSLFLVSQIKITATLYKL